MYLIGYDWRCKEKNDERRGEKMTQEEDMVKANEEPVVGVKREKKLTWPECKQREKMIQIFN